MRKAIQYLVRAIVWGSLVIGGAAGFAWYYDHGDPTIAGFYILAVIALIVVIRTIRDLVYSAKMRRHGKRGR